MASLEAAEAMFATSPADLATRLVFEVTTGTVRTCYVRAIDVLHAQRNKLQDVPLCDATGAQLQSVSRARVRSVLLTEVLAGSVSLIGAHNLTPQQNSVNEPVVSENHSVEHLIADDEDRQFPTSDVKNASDEQDPMQRQS